MFSVCHRVISLHALNVKSGVSQLSGMGEIVLKNESKCLQPTRKSNLLEGFDISLSKKITACQHSDKSNGCRIFFDRQGLCKPQQHTCF